MLLKNFKTVEELAGAIKSLDIVTSVAWKGYHDTSTIVGWSSYTTKEIWYKRIGKLTFVQFDIEGTSDSTSTSFTAPHTHNGDLGLNLPCRIANSGTYAAGFLGIGVSSSTVNFYPAITGGSWTASGTKRIVGQFWYQAA